MNTFRLRTSSGGWIKRVLLYALAGLFALYLSGATAGFLFVRYVRKNPDIGFFDVAFLRWREVRLGMAAQQFAKAQVEWDTGNYQAAFLAFTFAVNNDPFNIPGRLNAARFLQAAGSVPMALTTLEAGLARSPENPELLERTFDLLLSTGREQRALEILQQRPSSAFSGPLRPRLRTYELEARLNLGEVEAARKLVDQHELAKVEGARLVVSRVLWESKERLKAIELLSSHLQSKPGDLGVYAKLCEWQLAAGFADEAVRTAELARQTFPEDLAARILLLEAIGVRTTRGREWSEALASYLQDFGDRRDSLRQLAVLAGRRGWTDLARGLYEMGAMRESDLAGLALAYCDALMLNSRFREAGQMLAQVEAQIVDGNAPLLIQLRTRQVFVSVGLGDTAAVRENARRLAAAVRNDAGARELLRRTFQKANIDVAAAEFVERARSTDTVVRK